MAPLREGEGEAGSFPVGCRRHHVDEAAVAGELAGKSLPICYVEVDFVAGSRQAASAPLDHVIGPYPEPPHRRTADPESSLIGIAASQVVVSAAIRSVADGRQRGVTGGGTQSPVRIAAFGE
jgi:hypothetical protein